MADLEGVEGISASAISARTNGVTCWTWYILNQDTACMSACFLLCMLGLMQCKHTYMCIRYYKEMSLANGLVLMRVRGCGCRTCGPVRKR